jgi:hypothetical protein
MKRTFTDEQMQEIMRKRQRAIACLKEPPVVAAVVGEEESRGTESRGTESRGTIAEKKAPKRSVHFTSAKREWIGSELGRGSDLMVYQLAQDLMLDRVIAPLVKDAGAYKRHLPADLWDGFSMLPSVSFFMELTQLPEDVNLIQEFVNVYPNFISKELSALVHTDEGRRNFMSFVFWFVVSVFVSKDVQFYWRSDIGFGVKVGTSLAQGAVFDRCWAERVEITQADMKALQDMNSPTAIVKISDAPRSVRLFALFGPLAFVQHACNHCSNVTLLPKPSGNRNPLQCQVSEEVLTLCYAMKHLRVEEELFFCIKPSACSSAHHTARHTAPTITF